MTIANISHVIGAGNASKWRDLTFHMSREIVVFANGIGEAGRFYEASPLGAVLLPITRAYANVDALHVPTALMVYRNGYLYAKSDANADQHVIPPVEIGGDQMRVEWPERIPAPPNGTTVRVERGIDTDRIDNHILTHAETVLYSEALSRNSGRRLSTRLGTLRDQTVVENMFSGIHFLVDGNFSVVAHDQYVGGPNDVAINRDAEGGGQVPMLNGFHGSWLNPVQSASGGPLNAESDSYCGALRWAQGARQSSDGGSPPLTPNQKPWAAFVGAFADYVTYLRSMVAGAVQKPLGQFVKHPAFQGTHTPLITIDNSRSQIVVANMNTAPRAPGTTHERSMSQANQGPLVADVETRHIYGSKIDPETGKQVTEVAGALSCDGFIKRIDGSRQDNAYFDGPEKYHYRDLLPPNENGFVPTRTMKAWGVEHSHVFESISMQGRWDREVWLPMRAPKPDPEDPSVIVVEGEPHPANIYWATGGGNGGGHGLDTPVRVDATGFETLPLPAATWGEALQSKSRFAQLSRTRFPTPYDVDYLEAFDALPRGIVRSSFYQADAQGNPVTIAAQAGKMRPRAKVADYSHPSDLDLRGGAIADDSPGGVVAFHPSLRLAFGTPHPETDELVRDGWQFFQDTDGHFKFVYIASDGTTDTAKKLYANGTELGAGGGATTLGGLTDVTIASIADGELLRWDGAKWVDNTLSEAGIAALSHNHAAGDITSGTMDNARIAESNVTQHEAALTITESQISDLGTYVEESATDASSFGFVIDEDDMVSNDATKVPTQQSVKAYVAQTVSSNITLQGNYDASTNTPDLDTSPSGISKGDQYVVNVAGTFFTEPLEIGDTIYALQDNPTLLSHWAIGQANLTAASIKTLYESNSDTNAFTDAASTAVSNATSHIANTSNPHSVTKTQVGLANVTDDAQLKIASNLSDLANVATARSNLGLGTMAQETAADYVAKALFDANTIIAATSDNTPAALTVGEQTLVGRITGGNIAALTPSQIRTLINVADGATAGGGPRTVATEVTDPSASFTAAVGYHYPINVTTNLSDLTLTALLPPASTAGYGATISFHLKAYIGNADMDVTADGTDKIFLPAGTAAGTVKLYDQSVTAANGQITLESNGVNGWTVCCYHIPVA